MDTSWDSTWETIYSERGHCNRYPSEAVITFIMRHFRTNDYNHRPKILELGCGTGPNLWFLAREGFEAYGIDGSKTAIRNADKFLRKEGHTDVNLTIGDIAEISKNYPPVFFDAIVDGNCLQHNEFESMLSIVRQCQQLLKPGGAMYGRLVQTATDPTDNRALDGWGYIRRTTLAETMEIFSPFPAVEINESWQSWDNNSKWLKCWQVTAKKT